MKEEHRRWNLTGFTPAPVAKSKSEQRPSSSSSSSRSALEQPAYGKSISLNRLFADYVKNAINADELYKGQTYNIGGTVRTISTDEHGPVVELEVPCEHGACFAEAYFVDASGLASFRPGNRIGFYGTVEGVRNWTLRIKNCRLP